MYVLNFLSTRKIRDSDKTLKDDMIKRFINLEKFFNENEQYFKDKEGHYSDVTFPIKDVEKVKN